MAKDEGGSAPRSGEAHPATRRYAEHINPAFVTLLRSFGYGRVFVRAKGTRLWDARGREYLDFLAGFGAVNLGHNPPELVEALAEALRADRPNLVHVGPQAWAGELGAALAARVPELPMALLGNSGGEAVEAAMKLARAVTGRSGFLSCEGGYHGTGFGSLSVMGFSRFRDPFAPLLSGCVSVPFGELAPLEKELKSGRHAAFVVEPIQAEAGVRIPPRGYLAEAARLCRRHGTLFVLDEVQTGMGRTGSLFAYTRDPGAAPDVLVLGKSLGGSLIPISAALTTRAFHQKAFGSLDRFDLHGSTFSGNALACAAALATLQLLDDAELPARAEAMGERLTRGLRRSLGDHPLVREVRGRGLLVGLELGAPRRAGLLGRLVPTALDRAQLTLLGQWLSLRLLEEGILIQPASQGWGVLRFEPPLTVTAEEVDRVVDATTRVLGEYRSMGPLLRDAAARLGGQLATGWSFG